MGIGPVAATRKALERAGPAARATSTWSSSTRRSRRRRWPACATLGIDRGPAQPRRRRHRARPSARRHRRADHRQGGGAAAARGQVAGAGDHVHRRRPGHRHRAGGGLTPWRSERAAVIGAGVMGGGIAAQIANAGVPVLLLDIVPDGAERSERARRGRHRADARGRPGAVHDPGRGQAGDARQSRGRSRALADVDWIVEAIVEEPAVKQALYARLERVRKPGSIVSSNTSTIPLAYLTEGMPESFRARLPDHPFLQSAALHAPAGGGRRPDDPAGGAGGDRPTSPISASARAWCARKDTPGLHRQPHRHLLAAGGDRSRRSSWA